MPLNQRHTIGIHAVFALLKNHANTITDIFVQKDSMRSLQPCLQETKKHPHIHIHYLSKLVLDTRTNAANHQGILAISMPSKSYDEKDLMGLVTNAANPILLVLDTVQDPHNLGAALRSADAFGVTAVVVPKDKAVGLTPTVAKVASGAAETVPLVVVTNLVRALEKLKEAGVWIYGADMAAEQDISQVDLKGPVALVLGAEGKGLRRLTKDHCDFLIKIPMQGTVESLNVSVSVGICLYETLRQRLA